MRIYWNDIICVYIILSVVHIVIDNITYRKHCTILLYPRRHKKYCYFWFENRFLFNILLKVL